MQAAATRQTTKKATSPTYNDLQLTARLPQITLPDRARWAAKEAALKADARPLLTHRDVTHIAAAYFGTREAILQQQRRCEEMSLCRQYVWRLLRAQNPRYWSLEQLGRIFCRDHSTVLYALRSVERKMLIAQFAAFVGELDSIIRETGKWP